MECDRKVPGISGSGKTVSYTHLLENLFTVFLGGILGYLFSCVLVWLGRVWLFGSGEVELSDISLDGGLLRCV